MKLTTIAFSVFSLLAVITMNAEARVFGSNSRIRCGHDWVNCFGQITSLPTLIITSNGAATINPELVQAVNAALNSNAATSGEKTEAIQILLKAADELVEANSSK